MGEVIAETNVYGEDASGKRRLLYAAGDRISEEEAARLGLGGTKAKKKPADKAAAAAEDKDA